MASPVQYGRERWAAGGLLLLAAIFLALHAVHLTADFPNRSPWMDFAKYTDEGWYGSAAIRALQRGSWYVAGDFNPAAALPVWPLVEFGVFRVFGVSLIAARGLTVVVFAASVMAAFLLMRRWGTGLLPAASAVLLLAVSPFCFAFTRLAILEPPLVLLTLTALIAIPRRLPRGAAGDRTSIALGVLLPLLVLTKTTAVFLVPAILFLLWASAGYRVRPFLRVACSSTALALLLWAGYFLGIVRPRYIVDFHYVFDANAYTGITAATAWRVIAQTVTDGMWFGPLLFPLSAVSVTGVLATLRRRTPPLIVGLVLWVLGYAGFVAYHGNLQPRYYLVIAVPLTLLLPMSLEAVIGHLNRRSPLTARVSLVGAALAVGIIAGLDLRQTLGYVLHPEYSFVRAAEGVRRLVVADQGRAPLVLSGSGADLSLITGLPSICDDFGTMDLDERVALYRPGWFVAWNAVEDDKMADLAPLYRLTRVAAFPAFDDPSRNLMILYRLDRRPAP